MAAITTPTLTPSTSATSEETSLEEEDEGRAEEGEGRVRAEEGEGRGRAEDGGAEAERRLRFSEVLEQLKSAPWYWGPVGPKEAEAVLSSALPWSFIVRDSRSSHYLFSISLRTPQGVAHARVPHHAGLFTLGGPRAPVASPSLLQLVRDAMAQCGESGSLQLLMQPQPHLQHEAEPIRLLHPLSRHSLLPSLRHLARFAVLQSLSSLNHLHVLPISPQLKDYLRDPNYIAELP